MSAEAVPIYLEVGSRRTFACAANWPGWCRSGRTEAAALDTLAAYAPRYEEVVADAGLDFPSFVDFEIVERVTGSATTDFGAPGVIPDLDAEPLTSGEADLNARLVIACWTVFERVAGSVPQTLRKGPRGGGRDRNAIVDHVLDAEVAYARKLGLRAPKGTTPEDAMASLRRDIIETLRRPLGGEPLVDGGWPPRYAARRIAWHVLDHAWEMEDRSRPE